jgi:hypothetical protein
MIDISVAAFARFFVWMLEHNFLWLLLGVQAGIMLASFLYVYKKYGADAFKPLAGDGESDWAENAKQDSALAKKLRNMKKGKGGF